MQSNCVDVLTLHSTMFLLIPKTSGNRKIPMIIFTFHNVSINTCLHGESEDDNRTLHSTMFLLIPAANNALNDVLNPLHSTMFLLIPKRISIAPTPI